MARSRLRHDEAMTAASGDAFHPLTAAELRQWLEAHHTSRSGIWLVTDTKASGREGIPYGTIVDELLCFGWIDSKPNAVDATRSKRWIAPRRARSGWSRVNKAKVARLTEEGRMHPAGLAVVHAAMQDGSWVALDAVENLEVPEDLAVAFAEYAEANAHFSRFPRSVKKNILEWIQGARTVETRAKRIRETAERAARNERANQWRRSG
ncbi:MAG: hypothetical protein RL139_835 [Gemmatimonadota bacterium]